MKYKNVFGNKSFMKRLCLRYNYLTKAGGSIFILIIACSFFYRSQQFFGSNGYLSVQSLGADISQSKSLKSTIIHNRDKINSQSLNYPFEKVVDRSAVPNYNTYKRKEYSEIDKKYLVQFPENIHDRVLEYVDISIYDVFADKKMRQSLRNELIFLKRLLTATRTSSYVCNRSRCDRWKEGTGNHFSADFVVPRGTPIYSIANGIVIKRASGEHGFGNYVIVVSEIKGELIATFYAHLDSTENYITEGVFLQQGDRIGRSGNSGNSTVPHLDLSIVRMGDIEKFSSKPLWSNVYLISSQYGSVDIATIKKHSYDPVSFIRENMGLEGKNDSVSTKTSVDHRQDNKNGFVRKEIDKDDNKESVRQVEQPKKKIIYHDAPTQPRNDTSPSELNDRAVKMSNRYDNDTGQNNIASSQQRQKKLYEGTDTKNSGKITDNEKKYDQINNKENLLTIESIQFDQDPVQLELGENIKAVVSTSGKDGNIIIKADDDKLMLSKKKISFDGDNKHEIVLLTKTVGDGEVVFEDAQGNEFSYNYNINIQNRAINRFSISTIGVIEQVGANPLQLSLGWIDTNGVPTGKSIIHEVGLALKDEKGVTVRKDSIENIGKSQINVQIEKKLNPGIYTLHITTKNGSSLMSSASRISVGGPFNDYTANEKYYDTVVKLREDGIVQGSDGYLLPEETLTRSEMVALMMRAEYGNNVSQFRETMKNIVVENDGLLFDDVSLTSWYAPYVYQAYVDGVVKGHEGLFMPDDEVLRVDLITMLGRQYNISSRTISSQIDIENAYYAPYLVAALENNLIPDFKEQNFTSGTTIRRIYALEILGRYLNN